jgi:flagellar motor switch protein FliN/FliY
MAELDQENNIETQSDQSEVSIDNLKVLENIEVKLTVEVGSSQLKIRDLLRLNEGSVVELERLAGDPLDILANGVQIARGEVVMVERKSTPPTTGGTTSSPPDTPKTKQTP